MSLLKIYRNKHNELIVEYTSPSLVHLKKIVRNILHSKTVMIGVVGGVGVFIGIMITMTVLDSSTALHAEIAPQSNTGEHIKRVVLPTQGVQLLIETSVRTAKTTVIPLVFNSAQAQILQSATVGDEVVVFKSNNGVYYYSIFEIRTIATQDLQVYLESVSSELALYVPLNILKTEYRVYSIH